MGRRGARHFWQASEHVPTSRQAVVSVSHALGGESPELLCQGRAGLRQEEGQVGRFRGKDDLIPVLRESIMNGGYKQVTIVQLGLVPPSFVPVILA